MSASVHTVPTINNEASGPSYSVVRLCETLHAAGHAVNLAVLDPVPEKWKDSFVQGFPYGIGPRKLGNSPRMMRWLRRMAQSGSVDIMHNHGLWMLPNLYSALAVRGTRCKLVVSPQGHLG